MKEYKNSDNKIKSKRFKGNTAIILIGMALFINLFMLSFTSAVELNPFANTKIADKIITTDTDNYLKQDFNSKYGTIKISKTFLWIETDKIAEYSLIKNTDKCYIDCSAEGKAVLYQDGKLFEDKNFITSKGEQTSILSSQFYIKEIETYDVQIPNYKKICHEKETQDKYCTFEIESYTTETRLRENWVEYNYENLKAGNYEWKLIGKKSPEQSVDWIAISMGSKDLVEWSAWTTADCYGKGGNVTLNGNYCVHTFTDNGTFYSAQTISNLTILVIAGGGGGGGHGGGGGAGGLNYSNITFSASNVSVLVGRGGRGATSEVDHALNGTSSNFSTIGVVGGGAGGSDTDKLGWSGGSGGGGAWNGVTKGLGTAGQGYDGGNGSQDGGAGPTSGGGGGSGSVGETGLDHVAGDGGNGTNYSISGAIVCYAGGGGGNANAGDTRGVGRCGGGNAGTVAQVTPGQNGTGGGGGGSAYYIDSSKGGAGGNGIVIVSYDLGEQVVGNFNITTTLLAPIDYYNTSTALNYFNINATPVNTNATNLTLFIYNSDGSVNYSSTSSFTGDTNQSINRTFTRTLSDGIYNWTGEGCAINTTSTVCSKATNRTIDVDLNAPSVIIAQPFGNQGIKLIPYNISINYTATDRNLANCSYYFSFNKTNVSISSNQTVLISNSNINNTLFMTCNDTYNHINLTSSSWNLNAIETSQWYNNITLSGNSETFYINLTINNSLTLSLVSLNYNGTLYPGTINSLGNDMYSISRNLSVPIVSSQQNLTFYWNITFSDDTSYITRQINQSVNALNFDDCSVYTNQLFNLTMYDQDSQDMINGSLEISSIKVTFTLSTTGNVLISNYSKEFNKTNPARLCLQSALNNSVYSLDGIIEYSSTGRFTQFYNFQNYVLTNATDDLTLPLYNLNSTIGQEYKIVYKDSNFVPVESALVTIQRKYTDEGVFKTIEVPKTSTEGFAIGHLITNNVIYNILIYKAGVLLATFTDVVATCQNPSLQQCQINLNSYASSNLPSDFRNANDLSFTLTYNKSTRTVQSIYTVVSGAAATVNLSVMLYDSLGNTSVCDDSLYSSGGTLSCVVPGSFGNTTIIAVLNKNTKDVGQAIIVIPTEPKDIYGANIILISMIFFLLIVGIGASQDSPMVMGLFIVLGSIVLIALNLIYTPSIFGVGATILWFIACIILVMIKGSNRT